MGLPLTEARDHFEAQGARDALVELSGQLRTIAVSLTKVCNDLRWMGSGPRTGPGRDPPAGPAAGVVDHARQGEPGRPRGDADGVRAGDRQRRGRRLRRRVGQLRAQRDDAGDGPQRARVDRLLANASRLLADRCVDGITADVERCRELAESSPSVVTPLNRYLGYEDAAKVAKQSLAERKTIRAVVLEQGYVERGVLTEEQLDEALDVLRMTHP